MNNAVPRFFRDLNSFKLDTLCTLVLETFKQPNKHPTNTIRTNQQTPQEQINKHPRINNR
jgi:hypothetical protein